MIQQGGEAITIPMRRNIRAKCDLNAKIWGHKTEKVNSRLCVPNYQKKNKKLAK